MNLSSRLKQFIYPSFLCLLSLFVAYQNYIPGTWLTGWDVLHPEFNFLLNLKRALFSTWQEYQGLGFLGGNAYPAEIPRILLIIFFDIFLPTSFLRYFWVFLMLVLGPVGTYFLVKRILHSKNILATEAASFVAGVYYLFNLSTVQYYFTVFDPFATFYGFFPWFLLVAHRYLSDGGRRNLIILFAVFTIGASAFYIQTIFIVFGMVLAILILDFIIQKRKLGLKRSFFMLLVIFIANSYWILPNAYFTLTKAGITKESKINSYATIETRLMNEEMGSGNNVALLKGFWFNYSNVNEKGEFIYLMQEWRDHFDKKIVYYSGYLIFATVIIGLILGFFGKSKQNISFFPILFFSLCYFMLAQGNPPLGFVFTFISDNIPFFSQIFRSVFTKWSVVASLSYGIGIAYFVFFGMGYGKKIEKGLATLLVLVFCSLFTLTVYPIFKGGLVNKYQRLAIPKEYFSLFSYLDKQPEDKRIAYFPIHNFWGWNFHNWGNGTSGFLGYGIKQPLLDRASDVWSTYNEGFDFELPDAFYGGDLERIKLVLKKYDVSYILVDESIVAFGDKKDLLKYQEAKKIFPKIGLTKVWSEGFLSLYELPSKSQSNNYVSSPGETVSVQADMDRIRRDPIYEDVGDYINTEKPNSVYPFTYLLKEEIKPSSFDDNKEENRVSLKGDVVGNFGSGLLKIPALPEGTKYNTKAHLRYVNRDIRLTFDAPISIKSGKNTYLPYNLSDIVFDLDREVEHIFVSLGGSVVKVAKNSESTVYLSLDTGKSFDVEIYDGDNLKNVNIGSSFLSENAKVCWEREGSSQKLMETGLIEDILTFKVRDAAGCISTKIGSLGPDKVLVQIDLPFKSQKLSRPHFCLLYEGINNCINDDIFYATEPSREWTNATRILSVDGTKTYWMDVVARPPDFSGEEWSIDYKLPIISTYALVSKTTIDKSFWSEMLKAKEIKIEDEISDIEVLLLTRKIPVDFSGVEGQEPKNCDVFKRGWVEKTKTDEKITYEVGEKGAVCDYVYSPNITTDNAYIYVINGETVKERPFKFYLFNGVNKRTDLEVIADDMDYKKIYSVLPWPNLKKGGYTLNLEIRSFGEVAESNIKDVYAYTVPVEWLSKWQIDGEFKQDNFEKVVINEVEKIENYKYVVKVSAATGKQGVLVLSQGYDPGWLGFDVTEGIFKIKKLEHVKVNSWANGWMIEDQKSDISNQTSVNAETNNRQPTSDSRTILIVFWPQYLEFAGFGILIGGFLWILLGFKDKEKRLHKAMKN